MTKCRMLYKRCALYFSSLWRRVSHIVLLRGISKALRNIGLCLLAVSLLTLSPLFSSSVSAYSFPAGWTTHPIEAQLSYPNGSTRAQTYCNTRTSGSFNVSTLFPGITFSPWGGKIEANSILAITFDTYDGDVARTRISFNASSGSPLIPLGVDVGSTSTQVTYNVYYWNTAQINTGQILNHYLDIWIPSGTCMRMVGGVNYMKLNTNVNVDVDTSSIVNAVNNLNNTTTSLSTKIDAIDSALNGNNQKLDDLISSSNANSQAQIDAINEQTQQQQDQYEDEKQEESQREDEMDDQASQAEGIFTFDLTNPFSGIFGLFTNSNCVSIPTLAGLVGSNETTYCSWFDSSVRSILTPAIGIASTMIIFGFIVRWLGGSNIIEIGGK